MRHEAYKPGTTESDQGSIEGDASRDMSGANMVLPENYWALMSCFKGME